MQPFGPRHLADKTPHGFDKRRDTCPTGRGHTLLCMPEPSTQASPIPSRRQEFILAAGLLVLTAVIFWPAVRWLTSQTFAHEQLKQSFFIVVLAGGWITWKRRLTLRLALQSSNGALGWLFASYALAAGAVLLNTPAPFPGRTDRGGRRFRELYLRRARLPAHTAVAERLRPAYPVCIALSDTRLAVAPDGASGSGALVEYARPRFTARGLSRSTSQADARGQRPILHCHHRV